MSIDNYDKIVYNAIEDPKGRKSDDSFICLYCSVSFLLESNGAIR